AAEMALRIERENSDGIVAVGRELTGRCGGPARTGFFPFGKALWRMQALEWKTVLQRKPARPLADEQDMRRLLHDQPSPGAGMADVFQSSHGTAAERLAVHDAGIQLNGADSVG